MTNLPRNEKEFRAFFRSLLTPPFSDLRWIEPTFGSTQGLPDCFSILTNRRVVFFELKYGKLKNGNLIYSVQPEQKRELIRMRDDGAIIIIVVYFEGPEGPMIGLMQPNDFTIRGSVTVHGHHFGLLKTKLLKVSEITDMTDEILSFIWSYTR